uniref:Uncharacterized protein n=1 Tax=Nelumbo nucifera TaxID=4432 RepID=A0A822Z7Y6_NELNU|nr:TPA_asm: hypothetical protein HUJ06_015290 [Nelumbo nucifera]
MSCEEEEEEEEEEESWVNGVGLNCGKLIWVGLEGVAKLGQEDRCRSLALCSLACIM